MPLPLARTRDQLRAHLQRSLKPHIKFRTVLNNHSTNNPMCCGGPINDDIQSCLSYYKNAPNRNWICELKFAHAYQNGDRNNLTTEGDGKRKEDASNNACLNMLVELMLRNPEGVRLIHSHWSIPVEEVRDMFNRDADFGIAASGAMNKTVLLNVSVRASAASRYQPPQAGQERERESDIRNILHRCCALAKDGVALPHHLSHDLFADLARLVQPAHLKKIIAKLPDFDIIELKGKQWGFQLVEWSANTDSSHWQCSETTNPEAAGDIWPAPAKPLPRKFNIELLMDDRNLNDRRNPIASNPTGREICSAKKQHELVFYSIVD